MTYKVERGDFPRLENEWRQLLSRGVNHTVFSLPGWQRVWWEQFGGGELLLLSLANERGPVGIAPLSYHQGVISLVGSQDLCDYMDLIVKEDEAEGACSALLDYLVPFDWGTIDLPSLRADSVALHFLVPAARKLGYEVETIQDEVCPRLELPATWEGYLQLLGRKERHELKRKMRRLWEAGDVRYYVVDKPSDRDMDDLLDIFRQHPNEKKAQFMVPRIAQFFREVCRVLASEGYLRLFFLEVNGVRASFALCFDYGEELLLYNSSYLPRYSPLSAGLVLKACCIKEGIAGGKKRFDFLRGPERYKYELGGKDTPVYYSKIRRQAGK